MALYALNLGYSILEHMETYVGTRWSGPTKASWADRAGRVRPELALDGGPGREDFARPGKTLRGPAAEFNTWYIYCCLLFLERRVSTSR